MRTNWLTILKILTGLFFITTVFYAYEGKWSCELTFLSNFIAGFVLIIDGLLNLTGHQTPHTVYGLVVPCTSAVYLLTTLCTAFNVINFHFDGGMMFLHSVNPIIFLLIYLFGTDALLFKGTDDRRKKMILCPMLNTLYLVFDVIYYAVNGNYIYDFFTSETPAYLVILTIVVSYIISLILYLGITKLKTVSDTATNKTAGL